MTTLPSGATTDQVLMLARATPHDRVQWRADRTTRDNSKIAVLAYVDARYVMDTLDEIVGPENWQDRYEDAIGGYRCGIGIRINGEWVWKYDAAPASDIEGVKGGHSDSMKRAGVKWGIGRDLYDYPDLWVPAVETYPGSNKYKPAALPEWNGEKWIVPSAGSSSPARGNGRAAPSSARPSAPPARSSTDVPEPDFPPNEWEAAAAATRDRDDYPDPKHHPDNNECPIHGVTWNGEWGDLWHKDPDGKYCRHPENTRGPRAGARR